MPCVVFVQPDGSKQAVQANDGESVMHTAIANLVPGIVAECGGGMSCATCHVFVDSQWWPSVGDPSQGEAEMLEVTSEEPTRCSRLSCQVILDESLDGIVVHIPASQV